jgi:dihydrofolate reductase
MGKIILFIACSIDGKIADTSGGVDFLSAFQQPDEDYGTSQFLNSIDTIVLGRKTFDAHIGFQHWDAGKQGFVLSSKPVSIPEGWPVTHFEGALAALLSQLKLAGKNVWLEGGATLVKQALAAGLLDAMIITQVPVLVGEGISLFDGNETTGPWRLVQCKSFPDGVVQLHYERT